MAGLPASTSDGRPVLAGLEAVTFDFGNTLVPVDRAGLDRVVETTARVIAARSGPFALDDVRRAWAEERERQFREEIPRFREVDLEVRIRRVLARLRGLSPPPADRSWDDAVVAERSDPAEVRELVAVYSGAFIEALPPDPTVAGRLARLAARYRLAILSNWPLASTIDRYAAAAGWTASLRAIVVSQRVGTIKPDAAIFRATEVALGLSVAEADRILHVGDDWAADVVGSKRAGWRAAYLEVRPNDSPLPASDVDGRVVADIVVGSLAELEAALGGARLPRRAPSPPRPGGGAGR